MGGKKRIGVFFYQGEKTAGKIDYHLLAAEVKKLAAVEKVEIFPGELAEPFVKQGVEAIKAHGLNGIVAAGDVGRFAERHLNSMLLEAGINNHFYTVVDLYELCLGAQSKEETGYERALRMVKMAVFRTASMKEEVRTGQWPVEKKVLVVGAGVAGLTVAARLAKKGLGVTLIERDKEPGGLLRNLYSLYGLDVSPQEYLQRIMAAALSSGRVEIKCETVLEEVKGEVGNFTCLIREKGERRKVQAGAIVVATGLQTIYCPAKYGLRLEESVIGQRKLEKMLLEKKDFRAQTVVFIVGRTTENYLLPFVNAIKNALVLREKGARVFVLYRNLKVSHAYLEELSSRARQSGVGFIKFENDLKIEVKKDKKSIVFRDPFLGGSVAAQFTLSFDYLVVPEELLPADGTEELARILGIACDDAYLGLENPHYYFGFMPRQGIYAVGGCRMPSLVQDIEMEAEAVASEIGKKLLVEAEKTVLTHPQVDPQKCVVCLTCYRLCPHGAVSIIHDPSYSNLYRSAARMNPLACKRCGLCVAECPGKAIQLPGYTDDQILAQIEATGV